MVAESIENKNIVREEVQSNLDGDDEPVVHKVLFRDLMEIPKGQRLANPQKKLFMSHLLMSPENQKKIREADEVASKNEEKANNKAKLIKDLLSKNKKRKRLHAEQIQ